MRNIELRVCIPRSRYSREISRTRARYRDDPTRKTSIRAHTRVSQETTRSQGEGKGRKKKTERLAAGRLAARCRGSSGGYIVKRGEQVKARCAGPPRSRSLFEGCTGPVPVTPRDSCVCYRGSTPCCTRVWSCLSAKVRKPPGGGEETAMPLFVFQASCSRGGDGRALTLVRATRANLYARVAHTHLPPLSPRNGAAGAFDPSSGVSTEGKRGKEGESSFLDFTNLEKRPSSRSNARSDASIRANVVFLILGGRSSCLSGSLDDSRSKPDSIRPLVFRLLPMYASFKNSVSRFILSRKVLRMPPNDAYLNASRDERATIRDYADKPPIASRN